MKEITDTDRIDWLAHRDNDIGIVLLPKDCVSVYGLRESIDNAMRQFPLNGNGEMAQN